jgi:RNA polymerase sigma factor (sigma-70 family)
MSPQDVHTKVDALYRQSFGSLLNTLLHRFPDLDFEEAEDILQDSFSTALTHWQCATIPENPGGWLYKVARNKAINLLKNKSRFTPAVPEEEIAAGEPATEELAREDYFDDAGIRDHTLGMLFACAHPSLAPKTQMILTLKYVMNLKVEAIGKAFAMTIDGIDKILVRGRAAIRTNNIQLKVAGSTRDRLPVIHRIIYLIFNEGYKASYGLELIREELCEEALLLCKELLDAGIGDTDSKALYALMLFNGARLRSRFDATGKLVDLENQDRGLWDKDLIELGSYYLSASRTEPVTTFHIEASIALLHCLAPDFESTDWGLIAQLYAQLLRNSKNPFLELNYAVALFYAGNRKKAFQLANDLLRHPFFNQYYLLNATLGKFYWMDGEKVLAREYFVKAIRQTHFEIEKEFIQGLLDRVIS